MMNKQGAPVTKDPDEVKDCSQFILGENRMKLLLKRKNAAVLKGTHAKFPFITVCEVKKSVTVL